MTGTTASTIASWTFAIVLSAAVAVLAATLPPAARSPGTVEVLKGQANGLLACIEGNRAAPRTACLPAASELFRSLARRPPNEAAVIPLLAHFNVYWIGDVLIYRRPKCAPVDVAFDTIALNIHASDPQALPPEKQGRGFESLDFKFSEVGFATDGGCIAVRKLPAWPIKQMETGNLTGAVGPRWSLQVRPLT